jgi:hypothetical protein
MWPVHFEERLASWYDLRQRNQNTTIEQALENINNWWFRVPVVNRYLHIDDHEVWPGPWDLLADDVYCDLARALGIVYTVMMLDRDDIPNTEIIQTDDGNLVQVQDGKYILNWAPGELVNIQSTKTKINKSLSSDSLRHLLG